MAHSKSPAGAPAPGGDGNVVAGNSASLPKYTAASQAAQRAWSDTELSQLRKRQRDAWPHRVGEGFYETEYLPSFTVQHVADSNWWLVTFADGDQVAVRTGSFGSNTRFNTECRYQLGRIFARIAPNVWRGRINEAMRLHREGGES
jgi:hypothetical protein